MTERYCTVTGCAGPAVESGSALESRHVQDGRSSTGLGGARWPPLPQPFTLAG